MKGAKMEETDQSVAQHRGYGKAATDPQRKNEKFGEKWTGRWGLNEEKKIKVQIVNWESRRPSSLVFRQPVMGSALSLHKWSISQGKTKEMIQFNKLL
ncbi:hypothetical protein Csa_006660 [Cucumis sativus]|uniref:Uncharacterized protein n=1 Tax=Cucumis sativus TaxID=3659 RepID=A0A0A0LJU1_CUCSA|nr:hypothetical protein Csa_006660 [Cucumis sativus]